MLGLARAAQYAGWGSSEPGPLSINIATGATVAQELYQRPAFSYKYGEHGVTSSSASMPYTGSIDLTGYSSLPTANNNRWTMATTFKLLWPSGMSSGGSDQTYNFFHQANFKVGSSGIYSSGYWSLNQFTQLRAAGGIAITSRIETDYGIQRVVHEFPGSYETYNNRWLTCIYSCAETSSAYTDYTATQTTGTYYTRCSLYDTETGELLDTADGRFSPTNGFVPFLDLPTSVTCDSSQNNSIWVGGSYYNGTDNAPIRIANMWASYGTMFDPSALPDTSILTANPASQIGDAVAWYNIRFTEYIDWYSEQWVKAKNDDLYSQANDLQYVMAYWNDGSEFAAGYSTTDIPKDKS